MAFWTASYRVDTAVDRDLNLCWQVIDTMPSDETSNDFFGQFVDFGGAATTTSPEDINSGSSTIACLPGLLYLDPSAEGTISSAVSSADEFDYLSTSSHVGPVLSATSLEFDPRELPFTTGSEPSFHRSQQLNYLGRSSMSDSELQRLEEISIHSPEKVSASHPSSPTPPNTTKKHQNRIVEAISSTIRKATTLRRSKKLPLVERSTSPTLEHPPMAIKQRTERMGSVAQSSSTNSAHESSSPAQYDPNTAGFIHGFCDDPFNEMSQTHSSSNMRYYGQAGVDPTPMLSPGRRAKSDQELYHAAHSISPTTTIGPDGTTQAQMSGSWPQHMVPASMPEQWAGHGYVTSQEPEWWGDMNMFSDPKNVSVNQAMHSQHAELPYEYAHVPDAAGLMIHMPQPRSSQPTVANDLALIAQTYLPPPPPIPATERERSTRPPRAPSSGARHRNPSSSPMRKTRGPSASPQPQAQAQAHQSRHSSSGSISSVRSASGRVNGSIPGTPCGVRKHRSRDASLGLSNGDDMGFVNFTPNDGNILMTGVAPSGSSKTKARREKEAQERRRKLSEAAMKAVAAAGGDVDKLIQEGFVF
ncbi:Developmental regulatory protein wetA [Cladobotryum mycophilum]|uniref:Developmental regulatory protein wetA n=1 Tax=Cladobotryum mycophilum TaxID=491253 RepID=A0ABR0S5K0_9HYPO